MKAIFFDRDGVINIDHGYTYKKEDFNFYDGVKEALSFFRRQGYALVLVTNQSGIARGMYTEDDFWELSEYMQDCLMDDFAAFDAIYFCPHLKGSKIKEYDVDCDCRKPKPGMFLQAQLDLNLDLEQSIMIGDHASDLIAAKSAGIKKLVLVGEHISSEKEKLNFDVIVKKDLQDCKLHFKEIEMIYE